MRLGRQVLAGPFVEAGLLPASYYRHLVLEAMEAEDFPGALSYLKWAADPVLAQLLVLRLRLLAVRHAKQRQAILELLKTDSSAGFQPVSETGWEPALPEKYQDLLHAEDRALKLLKEYEARALAMLNRGIKAVKVPL
jgi:hypothetical protein